MKNVILLLTLFTCINYSNADNLTKPNTAQFGFIENKGQIIDQNNNLNPSVLYLYNGNSLHVQLKQNGFSYEVIKTESKPKNKTGNEINIPSKFAQDTLDFTYYFHRIDISFVNANTNAKIISSDIAPDYINYYTTGTSEGGVTNVHHYKKVLYQNIYNNIDVEFVLNDEKNCGNFKYNFIVHPNGNVNDIQLKLDGANSTSLTNDGHITIETAYGNIDESIPMSFQLDENNNQQKIISDFKQQATNIFGISIGNYDKTKTLIIDPVPWATYFGGSGNDMAEGISLDISGNIYTTGYTSSTTAIATSGAYQTTLGGNTDVFISKLNTNGSLQWATYYGGSNGDLGCGIANDINGNVYIIGWTSSTSSIASSGAYQTTFGGSADAFIAKFNSSGSLQWATYYGGSGDDRGYGISTDTSGNVYITGATSSSSAIATSGAYQTAIGGSYDAMIVKFNSLGSLQWGTYYGGSVDDYGLGITSDLSANIYLTGNTTSSSAIATTGAYQTTYGGGSSYSGDAYIAKFNSTGTRQWATYYGGSGDDFGYSIVTDSTGNIYFAGMTTSTSTIASSGAFQTTYGGGAYDAFVTKFNASGSRQWATYYGGTGYEYGWGISKDANGNIFITGYTTSTSAIATSGAYQITLGGNTDVFISKFNSSGSRQWATYYGGSGSDYGYGIVNDASGNVYITGKTTSTSAIATTGAYQTSFGGGTLQGDAFIAAFTGSGGLPVQLISFEAKLENKNVLCTWSTASEINNNYFEVQRSIDGSHFTSIGKVKGNGNTNTVLSYQFTDALTSLDKTNILYYRLRQVDFDGKNSLSEIKVVNINEANNSITIYPNPTNNVLNISFSPQSSPVTVQLCDITGRIIKTLSLQNNNNQIDISDLRNGIYFITMTGQDFTTSRKIIVNK